VNDGRGVENGSKGPTVVQQFAPEPLIAP